MKEKILVSACLLGIDCKYSGGNNLNEKVLEYIKDYEVIPVCPEIMGGLSTPRPPSERIGDKVLNNQGIDVTNEYTKGALETLKLAKLFNVKKALLKAKSPSCGKGKIYDGTFTSTLIEGNGVTVDLLESNGIEVISEQDL
ncbi:MAG: DUF523 domain-containing protein [Firmicutes bacterium]|nr:DUF523 domain-containing protein [Bacillota bacterium]